MMMITKVMIERYSSGARNQSRAKWMPKFSPNPTTKLPAIVAPMLVSPPRTEAATTRSSVTQPISGVMGE